MSKLLSAVAPLGPLLIAASCLGWSWLLARPRRPSRGGSVETPGGNAVPSLTLRQLAAIAPAPRKTPPSLTEAPPQLPDSPPALTRTPALRAIPAAPARRAPEAPEASVYDAPTAPIASADEAYQSMEQDRDVTVIDSIATMRARLQMTDLKPRTARAN